MIIDMIIGALIALTAGFAGGLVGLVTKQEVRRHIGTLNSAKEGILLLVGIAFVLTTTELLINTLIIFALGALTTTLLNKFWLGKANRYFELALLGLAAGAAFTFNVNFGLILIAFIVVYNIITESVAAVTVLKKDKIVKSIALTQSTFLFGAFLSYLLFAITNVTPMAFLLYIGGSIVFLVLEPRRSNK
jgi:hypothetical protein